MYFLSFVCLFVCLFDYREVMQYRTQYAPSASRRDSFHIACTLSETSISCPMGNDVSLYFPVQYLTAVNVPPLTGVNNDSTCAFIAFALLVICIFFILFACRLFTCDTPRIHHALHIVYNFLNLFSFIFQLIIFPLLYKA